MMTDENIFIAVFEIIEENEINTFDDLIAFKEKFLPLAEEAFQKFSEEYFEGEKI